jgi:uncharacterized cupredoxin-like copper-binding protein
MLAASFIAGSASAQDAAQPINVTLASYSFTPRIITLHANTTYRLHLVDASSGGHSFSAPEFFAASTVAQSDQAKIAGGTVPVDADTPVDVTVTPARAGTYPLRCTHFLHAAFGMTGQIIVR